MVVSWHLTAFSIAASSWVETEKFKTVTHILGTTREWTVGHFIELTVREITVLTVEPPAPPTAAARRQLLRLSGSPALLRGQQPNRSPLVWLWPGEMKRSHFLVVLIIAWFSLLGEFCRLLSSYLFIRDTMMTQVQIMSNFIVFEFNMSA